MTELQPRQATCFLLGKSSLDIAVHHGLVEGTHLGVEFRLDGVAVKQAVENATKRGAGRSLSVSSASTRFMAVKTFFQLRFSSAQLSAPGRGQCVRLHPALCFAFAPLAVDPAFFGEPVKRGKQTIPDQ